ncbi:MAG: disulfide bond formation protein B [Betaproteobacteria bacterium]
MTRYSTVPWPWAGLVLTLALLGQEILFRWFGSDPSLSQSLYRIGIMAIGVVSLSLIVLPPRRFAYLLGFLTCAGLMGWALWLQYGAGLEPCPLCVFQRIAVSAIGITFLVAFVQNPRPLGAAIYAGLILVFAGGGAAFASRQIWLQALPKDQVPACGMGFSYMMESFPFLEVLKKVFAGSGECAEKGWEFLGLAIPGWTLVFFIAVTIVAFALIRRDP